MPPAPIGATISYGPSLSPAASMDCDDSTATGCGSLAGNAQPEEPSDSIRLLPSNPPPQRAASCLVPRSSEIFWLSIMWPDRLLDGNVEGRSPAYTTVSTVSFMHNHRIYHSLSRILAVWATVAG